MRPITAKSSAPVYAQAIKKRIGVQIDTKAVDKELEGYQAKLKEVDLNKTRLEREIDSLPADAKYRERKLHDIPVHLQTEAGNSYHLHRHHIFDRYQGLFQADNPELVQLLLRDNPKQ